MMKLWFVLYVGSQIGASWGPLPYDMGECEERKKERQQSLIDTFEAKGNDPEFIAAMDGKTIKDFRVSCEYSVTRPDNSERKVP